MCKCDPSITPTCESDDCVMETDIRYAYRYLAKFGVKFVNFGDARALVNHRAVFPKGQLKTNIHSWWVKYFYDLYKC